jgi:hypothetical protein
MARLFLRVFIECADADAPRASERIRHELRVVSEAVTVVYIRRYWKIPEFTEVFFETAAISDCGAAVAAAARRLGTGRAWQHATEALWNPSGTSTFVEPAVRWAHVEACE